MPEVPEIQRVQDAEGLGRAAAGLFTRLARKAVGDRGRFSVALPGGATPRRTFECLAAPPWRDRVPWDRVEFFWGDERAVPPDHPESNFGRAREALLARLPVNPERIHRMPADRADLEVAAREYQAEVARVFGTSPGGEPPAFDLILLGMGEDGHTASLFAGAPAAPGRWVVPARSPRGVPGRLTLTPELINRAACVAFLVSGPGKSGRVADVLEADPDPDRVPSRRIRPARGRLLWLLDRPAAADLRGKAVDRVRVAPSILSADFTRLGDQVGEAERGGADRIHVDVMDGHFVPNLSMGPLVVGHLRRATPLPLESHLMVSDPGGLAEAFADAGSDTILFHREAVEDPVGLARRIRDLGMGPGVAIRPATPVETLAGVVAEVDLVLVMTVEPGFGGQRLLPETIAKIPRARALIAAENPVCQLEADGGIGPGTAARVVEAGARVLVAGSAVFGAREGVGPAIAALRRTARG